MQSSSLALFFICDCISYMHEHKTETQLGWIRGDRPPKCVQGWSEHRPSGNHTHATAHTHMIAITIMHAHEQALARASARTSTPTLARHV